MYGSVINELYNTLYYLMQNMRFKSLMEFIASFKACDENSMKFLWIIGVRSMKHNQTLKLSR